MIKDGSLGRVPEARAGLDRIFASRPRRSEPNIRVAAAPVSAEYPRRGRGVAATRLRNVRAANVLGRRLVPHLLGLLPWDRRVPVVAVMPKASGETRVMRVPSPALERSSHPREGLDDAPRGSKADLCRPAFYGRYASRPRRRREAAVDDPSRPVFWPVGRL